MKFYPYQKGGRKSFNHAEGGHKIFSHNEGGGGAQKVSTL